MKLFIQLLSLATASFFAIQAVAVPSANIEIRGNNDASDAKQNGACNSRSLGR